MKVKSIQGEIFPTSPFDFSKSINFMNMFTPSKGEQILNEQSFTKAVYIKDQTLGFKLTDHGTVEKPALSYTIFSDKTIKDDIKSELLDRIKFYLSLDDDLKPFYSHGLEDKCF